MVNTRMVALRSGRLSTARTGRSRATEGTAHPRIGVESWR